MGYSKFERSLLSPHCNGKARRCRRKGTLWSKTCSLTQIACCVLRGIYLGAVKLWRGISCAQRPPHMPQQASEKLQALRISHEARALPPHSGTSLQAAGSSQVPQRMAGLKSQSIDSPLLVNSRRLLLIDIFTLLKP